MNRVATLTVVVGCMILGPSAAGLTLDTPLAPAAVEPDATPAPAATEPAKAEAPPPGTISWTTPLTPDGKPASDIPNVPEAVTPYATLITTLGRAEELTPKLVEKSLRHYYFTMGFPVGPDDFEALDENATITFTYPLGDVDSDGVDDVAFNSYCVEYKCFKQTAGNTWPPPLLAPGHRECGTLHRLVGISGANGTPLWQNPLGRIEANPLVPSLDPAMCPIEFVVGTMPTPENRTGLLIASTAVYSIVPYYESGPRIFVRHTFHLVDGRDGATIWTYVREGVITGVVTPPFGVEGVYSTTGCYYRQPFYVTDRYLYADDLLVNPILQIPPTTGVRIVPNKTAPALLLQGVGFNYTLLSKPGPADPGSTCPQYLIESYQPNEWAAKLDMRNGKPLWLKPTFTPRDDLSVLPNILQLPPLAGIPFAWMYKYAPQQDPSFFTTFRGDVQTAITQYWHFTPCCFDLTGDGEPDLVYTTTEWYPYPAINDKGPFFMSSRLVAFDGATGDKIWEQVIEKGTQMFMFPETPVPWQIAYYNTFEMIGDADGDGASDILLHQVYLTPNFRHVLSVHKGTTGARLWAIESPRELTAMVLGDANQDGGNDVLVLDWFDWEFPGYNVYQLTNVTRTPLTLYSGDDGEFLWQAVTFNAPIDRYLIYRQFKVFGIPDINGDGVGDVAVDDPVTLPDLTVVHREDFLSGRDAKRLFNFVSVGTFAWPSYLGDYTGDGRDDFVVMSGDVMDLWFTVYDGAKGEALWSRRLMTPRVADYTFAVPRLAFHLMKTPNGSAPFVEFQLTIMSFGRFQITESLYPQAGWLNPNGTVAWAYPKFWDDSVFIKVLGPTPASAAFARAIVEAGAPKGLAKGFNMALDVTTAALPGAGAFAVAGALGYVLLARRRKA